MSCVDTHPTPKKHTTVASMFPSKILSRARSSHVLLERPVMTECHSMCTGEEEIPSTMLATRISQWNKRAESMGKRISRVSISGSRKTSEHPRKTFEHSRKTLEHSRNPIIEKPLPKEQRTHSLTEQRRSIRRSKPPPPPPTMPLPQLLPRKEPPRNPPRILIRSGISLRPGGSVVESRESTEFENTVAMRFPSAASEDSVQGSDGKLSSFTGSVSSRDRGKSIFSGMPNNQVTSAIPRGHTPNAARLALIIEGKSYSDCNEKKLDSTRKTIDRFDNKDIDILNTLVKHLQEHATNTPGLFVREEYSEKLEKFLKTNPNQDLSPFSHYQMSTLLMQMLRDMRVPLISEDIVSDLLFLHEQQPENYREIRNIIIFGVTPGNKKFLKSFMKLLRSLCDNNEKTHATSADLSLEIAFSILRNSDPSENLHIIEIFTLLIDNYAFIFGDSKTARKGPTNTSPVESTPQPETLEVVEEPKISVLRTKGNHFKRRAPVLGAPVSVRMPSLAFKNNIIPTRTRSPYDDLAEKTPSLPNEFFVYRKENIQLFRKR